MLAVDEGTTATSQYVAMEEGNKVTSSENCQNSVESTKGKDVEKDTDVKEEPQKNIVALPSKKPATNGGIEHKRALSFPEQAQ